MGLSSLLRIVMMEINIKEMDVIVTAKLSTGGIVILYSIDQSALQSVEMGSIFKKPSSVMMAITST